MSLVLLFQPREERTAADAVLRTQLLPPLTQMKCLYPTPPNQAKTLTLEEEQKCPPPPKYTPTPGREPRKSSFHEGIATWRPGGWGEGQLLEKVVHSRAQGGVGWRLVCSAMLAPSLAPSALQVPRAPRDIREDPVCLKLSQPFSGDCPPAPPLGVCTDSGGPSRPGVLNGAPTPRPWALFPLGPHVRSLFAFVAARCLRVPSGEGSFWKTLTRDEGPAQGQTQASLQPTDR